MTSTDEYRFFVPAWGISLTLHGLLVGLAFVSTTQVKPILQEDRFQWNVALVEASKSESVPSQAQSVVATEQSSAKVMPQSRPKRVTEVVRTIQPLEQKIEPSSSIEQKVETPQVREEPTEQRLIDMAEPRPEQIVAPKGPEPFAVAASIEPVATASTASPEPATEFASREAVEYVAPAPASGSEVKMDNRWVGESLWRRVAELKRYPTSARMNGQEGKVILKAVIRSDGQLADVFVQKSSGYSALDEAAIEAVKLACPLHMKHTLGKPLIVVSLPIVYSLAN